MRNTNFIVKKKIQQGYNFNCTTLYGLTEVFSAFSSVVRQMPGYNSQRQGTALTLPKLTLKGPN